MPAPCASAAARIQPVTPPMRSASGISSRSAGRECLRHLLRAHEVLADLDRRRYFARDARGAGVVVARIGSSIQYTRLVVDHAPALDRSATESTG